MNIDKSVCFAFVLCFDCCFSLSAETAIPICAKDISDDLMKEFAFLSGEYRNIFRVSLSPCGNKNILVFIPGGRGKDKAWIITLPDNAGFNEVPEEKVSKVLTYLTSVPRYGLILGSWLGGHSWVLPGSGQEGLRGFCSSQRDAGAQVR
ncbi:hypothetical protein Nmel_012912 [Mimus melanotis]